jgi:hypothetical protein
VLGCRVPPCRASAPCPAATLCAPEDPAADADGCAPSPPACVNDATCGCGSCVLGRCADRPGVCVP